MVIAGTSSDQKDHAEAYIIFGTTICNQTLHHRAWKTETVCWLKHKNLFYSFKPGIESITKCMVPKFTQSNAAIHVKWNWKRHYETGFLLKIFYHYFYLFKKMLCLKCSVKCNSFNCILRVKIYETKILAFKKICFRFV